VATDVALFDIWTPSFITVVVVFIEIIMENLFNHYPIEIATVTKSMTDLLCPCERQHLTL
jgi:hypothetical protein